MISTWYAHGVHMICTWYAHDKHMICTWCAHDMHITPHIKVQLAYSLNFGWHFITNLFQLCFIGGIGPCETCGLVILTAVNFWMCMCVKLGLVWCRQTCVHACEVTTLVWCRQTEVHVCRCPDMCEVQPSKYCLTVVHTMEVNSFSIPCRSSRRRGKYIEGTWYVLTTTPDQLTLGLTRLNLFHILQRVQGGSLMPATNPRASRSAGCRNASQLLQL